MLVVLYQFADALSRERGHLARQSLLQASFKAFASTQA
jgi:hypothetical protein